MGKIYALVFSLLVSGFMVAQTKTDSLFIKGDLFLHRDVSKELNIVADHIDKDVQPHSHALWSYYLSKPHPSVVTIEKYFNDASKEFGVPVEILKTIGQIENNWTQMGPSIDKGWGMMHLVQNNYCNTLHEAALLLHVSDDVLKEDARQNIRGAAALLRKYFGGSNLMAKKARIEDWYNAVKKFSGLISDELKTIQADRYYGVMKDGVRSTTLWNEDIVLARNSKIDISYIKLHFPSTSSQHGNPRSADYAPAVSSFTTCNYTSTRNHSIDTWVNHWIGTGTAAGAVSWFQNCSASASAHFVTANNGTIYQVVPVASTAWHCGASGYPYNNGRSIGEEHEATNANPGLWNSTAMLQASANMACYFCSQYGIATNQNNTSPGICGHQNMPGTNTDCPGTIPWTTWFNYFNNGTCSAVVVTPPNDYCGNEVTLTVYGTNCGATTTGDLTGATQSTAPLSCGGYTSTNAYDVWFKFVATSTAHDVTVVPTNGIDAVVDLRSGCPGTSIDCEDTGGGEGATEVLHATGLTVGATYNVRVYDYTGANNPATTSSFTICVTTPCTAPVEPIITGSHTVCSGQSTSLTVSNPCAGCTYSWSNGGSGTQITVSTSASYLVTAINSCATTVSDPFGVTVTSVVTPAVSISTPNSTICSGASVTFTAAPTNGGTTPVYQWTKNGANIIGAISATYTTSNLVNNDTIRVKMTSNASCTSIATVTSNAIIITVNPSVTPTISVSANPAGIICGGTNVAFTASITSGGTTPVYTWKKNNVTVGTNSNTYSSSSLVNGDVIYCSLNSNAACPSVNPVSSNSIAMSVTTTLTPAVSISANTGTSVCTGQSVTFTATPTNGGPTPVYQWKLNGNDVATGSSYTNVSMNDGEVITCVLTTSLSSCVTQTTATSNALTMNVSGSVTPSVSITASSSDICAGTSVTFSASPSGGGVTPAYQWKKNNLDISGAVSSTYTSVNLSDGDVITCGMTSGAACANPTTAASNSITMTVNSPVVPTISISVSPVGAVCEGSVVTFTSSITNGGSSPTYQWKSNGSDVNGATSPGYSSSNLLDGEVITCELTSDAGCVSPSTVISNSITTSIATPVTPTVSISSNQSNVVCAGSSITFTTVSGNGGNSPTYLWKVNGTNADTGNTYTTTSLSNGDVVTCEMTSSLSCVTSAIAISNSFVAGIATPVTPVLSITSNQGLTICAGTSVQFDATSVNGGTTPSYQWKVNGVNTGSGTSYTTSALDNGDIVSCEMLSSLICVTNNGSAISNALQMTVSGDVTPVVQANNCDLSATFIPNVSYQWYVNTTFISGAITRFFTVDQTGYYYVVVADSNFCTVQSQDMFVSHPACLPTNIAEVKSDLIFEIYEQANSNWNLIVGDDFVGSEVEIFDAIGRLAFKTVISDTQLEINGKNLASGVYLVRGHNDKGKSVVRRCFKL